MLEFIGWFVFGYILFQLISAWIAMQHIKHAVDDAIEEELSKREIAKNITVIRLDHVEQGPYSVILALEKETGRFLGQGNNEDETKEMLRTRYPKKRFVIVDDKDVVKSTIQPVDAEPV